MEKTSNVLLDFVTPIKAKARGVILDCSFSDDDNSVWGVWFPNEAVAKHFVGATVEITLPEPKTEGQRFSDEFDKTQPQLRQRRLWDMIASLMDEISELRVGLKNV